MLRFDLKLFYKFYNCRSFSTIHKLFLYLYKNSIMLLLAFQYIFYQMDKFLKTFIISHI